MKKLLFFCAALTATFTATGQHYYTDSANPDITRHSLRIAPQRVEFVLPEVGGYTVYKADLHTQSIIMAIHTPMAPRPKWRPSR